MHAGDRPSPAGPDSVVSTVVGGLRPPGATGDRGPVTDEVRIKDLREPLRTPEEEASYQFALSMEVDLDLDGIVKDAEEGTGLHRFGDPTLLDRLGAQVAAVAADRGLSGLGRYIVRDRLVGLLRARLRFEDYIARYPEALDVELEPPVIVVGLPRSGTTHLVNLLAADSRFRSMPWWRSSNPSRSPATVPVPDGIDPRYLRCQATYEITRKMAPLTRLMHDRPPWSIEEDCELVDLDLCSYTLEWHARVPSWRDYYLGLDQRAPLRSSSAASCRSSPICAGPTGGCSRPPSTSSSSARCCPPSRTPPSPSPSGIRSPSSSRPSPCWPTVTACAGCTSRPESSPPTGPTASNACCVPRSGTST